jgi:hypothetical protein
MIRSKIHVTRYRKCFGTLTTVPPRLPSTAVLVGSKSSSFGVSTLNRDGSVMKLAPWLIILRASSPLGVVVKFTGPEFVT